MASLRPGRIVIRTPTGPRRDARRTYGRLPAAATRTAHIVVLAAVVPLGLAAQDLRQITLRSGRVGIEPEPGSLLASPARLTVERLPLAHALARLSERARVRIAFSPALLPADHLVDCDCAALVLARALDRILEGTGLGYAELGSQVVVVPREETVDYRPDEVSRSGNRILATLAGIVRDYTGLQPIAFATVAPHRNELLPGSDGATPVSRRSKRNARHGRVPVFPAKASTGTLTGVRGPDPSASCWRTVGEVSTEMSGKGHLHAERWRCDHRHGSRDAAAARPPHAWRG